MNHHQARWRLRAALILILSSPAMCMVPAFGEAFQWYGPKPWEELPEKNQHLINDLKRNMELARLRDKAFEKSRRAKLQQSALRPSPKAWSDLSTDQDSWPPVKDNRSIDYSMVWPGSTKEREDADWGVGSTPVDMASPRPMEGQISLPDSTPDEVSLTSRQSDKAASPSSVKIPKLASETPTDDTFIKAHSALSSPPVSPGGFENSISKETSPSPPPAVEHVIIRHSTGSAVVPRNSISGVTPAPALKSPPRKSLKAKSLKSRVRSAGKIVKRRLRKTGSKIWKTVRRRLPGGRKRIARRARMDKKLSKKAAKTVQQTVKRISRSREIPEAAPEEAMDQERAEALQKAQDRYEEAEAAEAQARKEALEYYAKGVPKA